MARLRYVDLSGTIAAGNLTNVATSHTFTAPLTYAAGTTVPTLAGSDYFLLSILNTAGTAVSEVIKVTAYNSGTGAATIARAQEGTTGVAHTSGDKVLHAAYPSDFSSGVLAVKSYNPGSIASYAVSSTTVTDVDATNLAVTFTVPPSGNVLVAFDTLTTTYPGTSVYSIWSIREGSTTVASKYLYGTNSAENHHGSVLFYVTGLTPGDVKTYKWAHSSSTGGASITTHAGGIAGAAVMAVTAAP